MNFLFCASKIPLYANVPLDLVNKSGQLNRQDQIPGMLKNLQQNGIQGIIVDVWWGIVEQKPRVYNFKAYKDLLTMIKECGLKVRFIMSFHECGSSYNDSCQISLPQWVLDERKNDIFYKDSQQTTTEVYISLFADDLAVFGNEGDKRTPIQIYTDFMEQFRFEFESELNNTIEGLIIGLGPSGQLRYPGYRVDKNAFCGIGSFQSFDKHALASLNNVSILHDASKIADKYNTGNNNTLLNHSIFGARQGIKEVFNYQHKPNQTSFFLNKQPECDLHPFEREVCDANSTDECFNKGCCWDGYSETAKCFKKAVSYCQLVIQRQDCGYLGITENQCVSKGCCWDSSKPNQSFCFRPSTQENYQNSYGKFFLKWYETKLLEHGENIISNARLIFPSVALSIKIPSVFWMVNDSSRAAEATAGFIHTEDNNPYKNIMMTLKKYQISLIFSGFTTLSTDHNPICKANPEKLLSNIKHLSQEIGIDLIGEPSVINDSKSARYDIAKSQLDNLNAYIPFRASWNYNQGTGRLYDLLNASHSYETPSYYRLKDLKKLLVIVENLNCEDCLKCKNEEKL